MFLSWKYLLEITVQDNTYVLLWLSHKVPTSSYSISISLNKCFEILLQSIFTITEVTLRYSTYVHFNIIYGHQTKSFVLSIFAFLCLYICLLLVSMLRLLLMPILVFELHRSLENKKIFGLLRPNLFGYVIQK